jgi:hypothetical protein
MVDCFHDYVSTYFINHPCVIFISIHPDACFYILFSSISMIQLSYKIMWRAVKYIYFVLQRIYVRKHVRKRKGHYCSRINVRGNKTKMSHVLWKKGRRTRSSFLICLCGQKLTCGTCRKRFHDPTSTSTTRISRVPSFIPSHVLLISAKKNNDA